MLLNVKNILRLDFKIHHIIYYLLETLKIEIFIFEVFFFVFGLINFLSFYNNGEHIKNT